MNQDHLTAAVTAQFNTAAKLAEQSFASVEKLTNLNITYAQALLADVTAYGRSLLSATTLAEVLALNARFQPCPDKLTAYAREVQDIGAALQAEVVRAAENHAARTRDELSAAFVQGFKPFRSPAVNENAAAFVKSMASATSHAIQDVQKAVEQASEAAEAQLQSLVPVAARKTLGLPKKSKAAPAAAE